MAETARQIMILDDEEVVRVNLAIFFEDEGFIVHTAGSAKEGFALLSRHPIDAGIVDIRLPGMNGIAFLKHVRQDYPHTLFLVYTGSVDAALSSELLALGVSSELVFKKPLKDMSLLVNAVETLLR